MTTNDTKSAFADRSERELVLSVVRDDFGGTAEQVALALLRADGLRLVEIVARVQAAATGIRPSETEVKANLLKLLQHNLLRIAPVATPRGTATSYSMNVAEVLYRLRFPKFTELAKEAFGVEGEIIMEEILVHGRVRMDQSIDAMAFSLAEHERQQDAQRGADDEISESELDESRDRIREAFVEMAKKRYVSRVHPLDMKLPEPEETPDFPASIMRGQETDSISTAPSTKENGARRNGASVTGKAGTTSAAATGAAQDDDGITVRGGKRKKPVSGGGNNVPIELQMMLEADVSAAKSRGPDDGEVEFETEQERQSKKRKAGGGGGAKRAKLPSRGATSAAAGNGQTDSEDSETTGAGMAENSLVWRCGVDQLLRDLRHRACIKFATENFNHVAGVIVKAMLAHSSPHERHHNEPLSHPVTARELFAMDDVKAALPNNIKDTWRLLLNYVTVMCRDKSGMVMKTAQEQFDATLARAGDGGQYVVHMKKIVEFLRQSTTHSYVQEKYGVQSARIVRLLMEKRQLEEKPIGELALLPPNDARRRLYELYREGLTKLQEIPKRADHNPSFTLFCWSVDVPQMEKRIAQRIQDSLTKLRRRRKAEADENKDLIARSDQLVEANDLAKFDKLSRALDRLDRAIIHLDNMLMLYRDF